MTRRNKVSARDREASRRLHERRNHLAMAETTLAMKMGTTAHRITRVERCKEAATRSFLAKAAEALMVDIEFFYDGVLPSERIKPATRRRRRIVEEAPPLTPDEPPIDQVDDEVPASPSEEYVLGLLRTIQRTKPTFFRDVVKMIAVVATGKLPEE